MSIIERIRRFSQDPDVLSEPRRSPCEVYLISRLSEMPDQGEPVRYHLLFSGEVQAVGFRWTNRELANQHGLTGWVRNLDGGTVVAELQGTPAAIRRHFELVHAQYLHYGNDIWLEQAESIPPLGNETGFSVRF